MLSQLHKLFLSRLSRWIHTFSPSLCHEALTSSLPLSMDSFSIKEKRKVNTVKRNDELITIEVSFKLEFKFGLVNSWVIKSVWRSLLINLRV
ncbi:hypothetical protein Scep_019473 [Stephania cephalantha]|uniref:Uncharacterized protein n=1 Tax=Stephania cephalantha TaxID=152367 RepID=A0AAP0NMY5_9MAGN